MEKEAKKYEPTTREYIEGTLSYFVGRPIRLVIESMIFIMVACIPLVFIVNAALSFRTNIKVSYFELWYTITSVDLCYRMMFK